MPLAAPHTRAAFFPSMHIHTFIISGQPQISANVCKHLCLGI